MSQPTIANSSPWSPAPKARLKAEWVYPMSQSRRTFAQTTNIDMICPSLPWVSARYAGLVTSGGGGALPPLETPISAVFAIAAYPAGQRRTLFRDGLPPLVREDFPRRPNQQPAQSHLDGDDWSRRVVIEWPSLAPKTEPQCHESQKLLLSVPESAD
jgi:hypothetical protein